MAMLPLFALLSLLCLQCVLTPDSFQPVSLLLLKGSTVKYLALPLALRFSLRVLQVSLE